MLDSTFTPVIIDFDSCCSLGERIVGKGGTFGWTNDAVIAEVANDWYGLDKIEKWLLRGGKEEYHDDAGVSELGGGEGEPSYHLLVFHTLTFSLCSF